MCLLATTFGCFFDHQHAVSVLRGECKHRLIFILDTPAVLPYFLPIRGKDGTGGYLSISFQYGSLGMAAVKATPVASFVILALVWLRGENLSIFISFLMVLPLVWQNTSQGIAGADHPRLEMARVSRLSPQAVLRAVYLPAALPHLLSALRVGLGFAWKAGIAGEVLAIAPSSIGRQLHDAKTSLEMVDLFAWTGFIILLSVALERGMVALLARIFPGKEGS